MVRQTGLVLTLALLATPVSAAWAKEPATSDLVGVWTRRADGHRVTVTIRPDLLRFTFAVAQGVTMSLDADYVLARDGTLVGILRTRTNGKEMEKTANRIFHCRCEVTKDALLLGRLEGNGFVGDDCVKLAEGMFRRVESRAAASNARIDSPRAANTPERLAKPAAPPGAGWQSLLEGLAGMVERALGGPRFLNVYSSDPDVRMKELINQSEDLRHLEYEWERIWFTDQPSHLTPERINGPVSQVPAPSTEYTPVPVFPWTNERKETGDFRTKPIPPVRGEVVPRCDTEPDRETVLRALPSLQGKAREDAEVVIEKIVDSLDPPRHYPLLGQARLHRCHWKCTVYHTQTIYFPSLVNYAPPTPVQRPAIDIVYIDTDHLHLCDDSPAAANSRRLYELLNNSEDIGPSPKKRTMWWERLWFSDQPSHLTPERVHGGIQ